MINEELKIQLRQLADQYETTDFLINDPAQFMHRFKLPADIEIMGLIASSLALGQRKVTLDKLEYICSLMQGNPEQWIEKKMYQKDFPDSYIKFYRFFSYSEMRHFFDGICLLMQNYGTIGNYLYEQQKSGTNPLSAMSGYFVNRGVGAIIPQNTQSACKRLNLYFRWMVRDHSQVDMGLWTWFNKQNLILPLDTHVMDEVCRLGLSINKSTSLSKARELTNLLCYVWPDDPCKGDFALFGAGVNRQDDSQVTDAEKLRMVPDK